MNAGSGVYHDEAPTPEFKARGGRSEGFQIWVNLPRALKMSTPSYQDLHDSAIPRHKGDLFEVKVISGSAFGIKGPIDPGHGREILYLDFHTNKGAAFSFDVPEHMNAGVYVYRGRALFGSEKKRAEMNDFMVLKDGNSFNVEVDSDEGCLFLVLAGVPFNEPVARRGPFVMVGHYLKWMCDNLFLRSLALPLSRQNTDQEIRQCFEDIQRGTFVKEKGTFKNFD
jgi:redox-sensitive bicupin YhaK (pirin superfamily)